MPSKLKLTLVPDGVTMVIVAVGLLSTKQFAVAFSPTVNAMVSTSLSYCGASKNVA